MHALTTLSDLENQMRHFTDLLFWQMFYNRHNHTKKCRRYQQLMRSINSKYRLDNSKLVYLNKEIMRRATLNRL